MGGVCADRLGECLLLGDGGGDSLLGAGGGGVWRSRDYVEAPSEEWTCFVNQNLYTEWEGMLSKLILLRGGLLQRWFSNSWFYLLDSSCPLKVNKRRQKQREREVAQSRRGQM